MRTVNVLILDDHQLMIEGYKSILPFNDQGIDFEFTWALDCEAGYKIITNPAHANKFDMVFLDRSMPAFENIQNGDDLARLIKKHWPKCLIVILTSHAEAFVLYDIVKKIDPAGLLVKSDFTADELLNAVVRILNGEVYYSNTVRQNIREIKSRNCYLDNYNRQIISLLNQGIKTKNLPDHLPLSISAIDKRKVQIKDYFNICKGGDEEIIREARIAGFI